MPAYSLEQRPPAIGDKLAKQLEGFRGRWVAVFQDQVVASGGSAREALDAAIQKGVTDPTVFRVTTHVRRVRIKK